MKIKYTGLMILGFALLFSVPLFSQDYSWWNEKHNWDGVTHWSRYIIISPSYLGPNALPVPPVKTGSLEEYLTLEIGADSHISRGDKTINPVAEMFIPLSKGRVGLNLNWIPFEYYNMDTITRDKRRARDYNGKGFSTGDLIIGTYIQILKERSRLPDILLTINLKTASGSNLSAARHTDSPGYYFDLSFGKKYSLKESQVNHIRVYGMIGLYAYQTNYNKNYQNDAFQFGAGINVGLHKIIIENKIGGYIGYIGDGDKPVVYRFVLKSNRDKTWNFKIQFQQGMHDFDYSTFRISALVNFTKKREGKTP